MDDMNSNSRAVQKMVEHFFLNLKVFGGGCISMQGMTSMRLLLTVMFFAAFFATIAESAEGPLPEDITVRDLKFVDGTGRYAETVYLKDYVLSNSHWIDDHRKVSSLISSKTFSHNPGNTPKVVIVDTKTGVVKDTGYVGEVQCYNEGRIATHNIGLPPSKEASYFGRFGEPLQAYPLWFPRHVELNVHSCQLVPRWKRPETMPIESFAARYPLKIEHGAIFVMRPKDFPVLQLGVDANNRPALIRSGTAAVPPLVVYLEQPSGKRIDIPVNPGEKIDAVQYIPFENAYLLNIDLTNTQPIKAWEPRFARLLYPDGTVKRYSVPKPIMDLVKANKAVATATYTKLGMGWHLSILSQHPDLDHLNGNYLVIGKELVKISASGTASLDGCKLYGSRSSSFSKLQDYYFIDICKGK